MEIKKVITSKDFIIGLSVGIILIFIPLFFKFGLGFIIYEVNRPEITITEGIVLVERAPETLFIKGRDGSYTLGDAIGGKPTVVAGIETVGDNPTPHCILNWLISSDIKSHEVKVFQDLYNNFNESSYPYYCKDDCIQFTTLFKLENEKDIEDLYGKFCFDNFDLMLPNGDKCFEIEQNGLIQNQKEIVRNTYIKIDLKNNESLPNYIERNKDNLFPKDILVRDKNYQSLKYKQIKIVTQDILNCKVY